ETLLGAGRARLAQRAPAGAVVLDLVVPLVVGEDLLAEVLLLVVVVLHQRQLGQPLLQRRAAAALGVVHARVGGAAGWGLFVRRLAGGLHRLVVVADPALHLGGDHLAVRRRLLALLGRARLGLARDAGLGRLLLLALAHELLHDRGHEGGKLERLVV